MEKVVYTVKEIQEILGISKNVAYNLIKQKEFPVLSIKSTYRIPKEGFDEWVKGK